MNIQAKERVVGAIVLVSLAVIFIPMLLPGKGDIASRMENAEVPPAPDYRFPPMEAAPEAPTLGEGVRVPVESLATAPVKATPSGTEPASEASTKAPASKPETPPAQTNEAKPVESKPSTSEAQVAAPSGQVTGWIVQVGSFSSQENASALRDKLRKQGFASFVEKVNGGANVSYRVRVGPELTRDAAERLQQKLAKTAKLNGLVQQYP